MMLPLARVVYPEVLDVVPLETTNSLVNVINISDSSNSERNSDDCGNKYGDPLDEEDMEEPMDEKSGLTHLGMKIWMLYVVSYSNEVYVMDP